MNGRRAITPEMSYLIGTALGMSPDYWVNLETTYQLKKVAARHRGDVEVLV